MVLKPLNNDDIEASESDEWGFFGPFYQGMFYVIVSETARLIFSSAYS